MNIAALRACRAGIGLAALTLAACSALPRAGPDADTVAGQARQTAGVQAGVQFDIVKIDDRVLHVLHSRPGVRFSRRFKAYQPPPKIKIAVGDTLSVIVWESGPGGLFTAAPPAVGYAPLGLLQGLTGAGAGGTPATSPGAAARQRGGRAGDDQASTWQRRGKAVPPPGATAPASLALPKVPVLALSPGTLAAKKAGEFATRIPDQQVGLDGAISIPYGGRVPVAGATIAAVQRTIERRLAGRALDPQALVLITASSANAVSVTGSVVKGARVPLTVAGERLLQIIAAAGGAKAPVRDIFVKLSRGGVTATMPLAALVADPGENIYARPGDVLTLVQVPQTFSVFGATGRNASIRFGADRLSLAEALGKSGGLLDQRADPRGVFLFRYEPAGVVRALGEPVATGVRGGLSPVVYRLDLADAKSYLYAREFPVHDKDIIFVANAKVAPVYKFFALLSQITGPVATGFVTCYYAKC